MANSSKSKTFALASLESLKLLEALSSHSIDRLSLTFNLGLKKVLGLKKILCQKNILALENIWGPKHSWVRKKFGSEKFFVS